ncbi:MAG: glycosyltransferase, partial [Anaerolineales bacterium]|nr:glycosyltransferase [Anaerolineales bacterium]
EYTRLGAVAQLRQIMPLVNGRCSQCHFVFACRLLLPTDAGIKADLEKWVAANGWTNRVHFLGEVPDFPTLLHASDLFLFPATDMTGKIDTPLTILEAMAAGLPVLAYQVRSLEEIFGQGAASLLPNGDVDAMAAAIIDLVQYPNRRQHLGQQLRQIVQARYDLQKMVAAYETLYSLLI